MLMKCQSPRLASMNDIAVFFLLNVHTMLKLSQELAAGGDVDGSLYHWQLTVPPPLDEKELTPFPSKRI